MKKGIWKWTALCLGAALLGGCGSQDSQEGILEELGVPLNDGPAGAAGGVGSRQEAGEGSLEASKENGGENAGEGSAGTPEENGGGSNGIGSGQESPALTLSPEEKAMYEAYIKALEDIYFDQNFPGGMQGDLQPEDADISENKFAVCDIDSDGKEELIISYITTYMAGMVEAVYAYDSGTGELRQEFLGFPLLTYYDNEVIEEKASHNQGMASDGGADGNFWPYSLHRYDPVADTYVSVAYVDAWSKGYNEKDWNGNPFPEEADIDGDGVVYYIMEGDYQLVNPKDGEEYNQWRDSCLKGAKQLEIPYRNLTTDNIYALGREGGVKAGEYTAMNGLNGKQIAEQSFPVTLDGWGEVIFASFAPIGDRKDEAGQVCFGDVRFALLKEGKQVYVFPGENEENVFYGQQFGQVLSVAFRDYNEDGRTDILVLLEYAGVQGPNIDVPARTVRAYTQEEGKTEFFYDQALSEYLKDYTDSMEEVSRGLESYAGIYAVATDKSAWEVERFARKVKRQIMAGDFEGLCESIAFPVTIDGTVYQDKEAILGADFIDNRNPAFLEAVWTEPCGNMFVNYQGIAMGDGCVWISEILDENMVSQGLKVYGINGLSNGGEP